LRCTISSHIVACLGVLFANELDLPVDTLFVHLLDLDLSFVVNGLEDLFLVEAKTLSLDLLHDFWILREHNLMHELLCKGESFDVSHDGHVDKLTLAKVDDVVVTDQLGSLLLLGYVMLLVGHTIGDEAETDSNHAFGDEVHFGHFLFFVVDNFILFSWLKLARHKSERNVVEESRLLDRVDAEESLELLEDVAEQVNCHDLVFELARQCFEILVVGVQAG